MDTIEEAERIMQDTEFILEQIRIPRRDRPENEDVALPSDRQSNEERERSAMSVILLRRDEASHVSLDQMQDAVMVFQQSRLLAQASDLRRRTRLSRQPNDPVEDELIEDEDSE